MVPNISDVMMVEDFACRLYAMYVYGLPADKSVTAGLDYGQGKQSRAADAEEDQI